MRQERVTDIRTGVSGPLSRCTQHFVYIWLGNREFMIPEKFAKIQRSSPTKKPPARNWKDKKKRKLSWDDVIPYLEAAGLSVESAMLLLDPNTAMELALEEGRGCESC